MNREAIIERVTQRVWSEHYDELSWRQQEEERANVGCVLDAAGFFDLLEATEEATRDVGLCEECVARLDASIAKITGGETPC